MEFRKQKKIFCTSEASLRFILNWFDFIRYTEIIFLSKNVIFLFILKIFFYILKVFFTMSHLKIFLKY